jgi:hypothetical protein
MHRMRLTPGTVFFVFYTLRMFTFVLCCRVVSTFAFAACQDNCITHGRSSKGYFIQ